MPEKKRDIHLSKLCGKSRGLHILHAHIQ